MPEERPQVTSKTPTAEDERKLSLSVIVGIDSETNAYVCSPFYNGTGAAEVHFPEGDVRIKHNSNWRFPYKLVNKFGQELWLDLKNFQHVLAEIGRYAEAETREPDLL